uniref:Cell division cycle protein 20 homolog n=1 Tax=Saccoglossus kowalevskii TaxID=10224 RepID=A0ABM0M476_SACKO|nr:PREDICTED: cell division cycle protein 20 homolog [Saccoglossus kowalevskii]
MAHFQFETSINELVRLNAPVGGPKPRWQRKQDERTGSDGCGNRLALPLSPSTTHRRPSASKTPSKSPHNSKSPLNSTTPKCKSPVADRFIPNRNNMDIDRSHFLLTRAPGEENDGASQKVLQNALNEGQPPDSKILSFKEKAPRAAEGYHNSLRVLYSTTATTNTTKAHSTRLIPTVPDRILDAPDLRNDFYLKLIDWGSKNVVAAALGCSVYLWSANSGTISHLSEVNEPDYISGVCWLPGWNVLAVGISNGTVEIWDVELQKCMRRMSGHAGRISSLSWNSNILSRHENLSDLNTPQFKKHYNSTLNSKITISEITMAIKKLKNNKSTAEDGIANEMLKWPSASGSIHNHDVRVAEHHVGSWVNHEQEVCGLAWSQSGEYLASGGNDNIINIWDASNMSGSPLYSFSHHMAAVKALSWCPWQQSVLASGAGIADRTIRFWNVNTGLCLNTIDTGSQVSGILWSQEYKELISGHGYSAYHLAIWKYPSMKKVADLKGHVSRILAMTQSPDEENVMTAGADETLQIWNCFKAKQKLNKSANAKTVPEAKLSMLARSIR